MIQIKSSTYSKSEKGLRVEFGSLLSLQLRRFFLVGENCETVGIL